MRNSQQPAGRSWSVMKGSSFQALAFTAVFLFGCGSPEPTPPAPSASPLSVSGAPSVPPTAVSARPAFLPADVGQQERSGSGLARTADSKALILADEDHAVLRWIPLPVDVQTPPELLALPGRPAQVLALSDRVLVTIREPGMLLELTPHAGRWVESARLELPDDAWGMALSADGKTVLVTSAWSHQVTAVDLQRMAVRWIANVAREPRGVVVAKSGRAYVSHLMGSRVTRIDDVNAAAPVVLRVEVMPSPLRSPPRRLLDASLGYSAVLSPDEERLFLPRHALGAQGFEWWFGQPTVDVVLTADDSPLAPSSFGAGSWANFSTGAMMDVHGLVALTHSEFVQPRAAVYRRSTHSLLVASEGNNKLVELDARVLDPSLATKRVFDLASYEKKERPFPSLVRSGGAPSAIALSADEKTAWVFCRSTNDLVIVSLDETGPIPHIHLADDSLSADAQKGKVLYYDALDPTVSGGLACAGCHPDGRDDGHTWHEIVKDEDAGAKPVEPTEQAQGYRAIAAVIEGFGAQPNQPERGFPRQTPMLAGRVKAIGPYGWRGESPALTDRVRVGFALHRWQGDRLNEYQVALERPQWLAAFVREGLVAPRVRERELQAVELRGQAVFANEKVGCVTCHSPETEFSNRSLAMLIRPRHPGFEDESATAFKTPSLLFVGGTPPYFHDGTASSLEELIRRNGQSMGDTARLSAADQAALAAYLRTLGGYVPPFPEEAPPRLAMTSSNSSSKPPGPVPLRGAWNGIEPFEKAGPCSLSRKESFIRLHCDDVDVVPIAGAKLGVGSWADPKPSADTESGARNLVFSLLPGDRRVIQLTREEAVGKWGTRRVPSGLLQAHWLDGEAEPTLSFVLPANPR